ncbi:MULTISPECIES: GNAT family N-acetyltransferase [unclassified Fusibacter]|uniref:GNAT family N-acetyltransferase n=1 Tax=unclassified Fusibacter TaxID=2624464 RepID=UPI0013E969EA|nr:MULTISPECIES: GNAT family N-acetyltransferase [unclassified Fusibacter]MCK8058815.1 GNAT family N-acetyltransferase [Fusibacter sp. A2]NPE21889.1 GNAT family N-acetyltransferase [Fusibacter sp. A1]
MILYKIMKQADFDGVDQLLMANGMAVQPFMTMMHNATILVIDNKVCGYATYKMTDDETAELKALLIDKDVRAKQYGDGLIKALLNNMEQRGITKVYASSEAAPVSFLEHVGFDPVSLEISSPEQALEKDASFTHVAKLPEFFDTACKSKRK